MKLKYTGLSHERSFRKSDFDGAGVEGGSAVKFNADNNWIAEVEDSVGEWLVANDSEFREATEQDEGQSDVTRVGSPGRLPRASTLSTDSESGDASGEGGTPEGAMERSGRGSTARKRS